MSCNQAQQQPCSGQTGVSAQAEKCLQCGGLLFVFVGAYSSWQECASCESSQLLGWSSCQVGVINLSPSRMMSARMLAQHV